MVQLGYTLSSEEFRPQDLADHARLAEEAGFAFASISDHFHPWLDSQGHSPFVWGTLGAISQTTNRMLIGTGVTCPLLRTHPAIIAQAAATAADLLPGQLGQELALPRYFEQAAELVTTDRIKESIACGPDVEKIHQQIQEYVDAGFTHVYLHQVGPDQRGFIDLAKSEILPRYA